MQLQIKVYAGLSALEQNSRLFERILEVNESISIPYELIVNSLKFMFGSSCIVCINVQ